MSFLSLLNVKVPGRLSAFFFISFQLSATLFSYLMRGFFLKNIIEQSSPLRDGEKSRALGFLYFATFI